MSDFEKAGDDDVLQKVLGDLKAAGKPADAAVVRRQMDKLIDDAKQQIMDESK